MNFIIVQKSIRFGVKNYNFKEI